MMKYLIIILIFTTLSFPFQTRAVSAQSDSGGSDFILEIVQPVSKDTVFGNYPILIYSDIQTSQADQIDIYLYTSECIETNANYYGKVGKVNIEDSDNNYYKFDWFTSDSIIDAPSPPSGLYCLIVKATDNNKIYKDSIDIVINNQNIAPPFISKNIGVENYLLGQDILINLETPGEESSNIRYSFLSAPEYLDIDSSSGKITNDRNVSDSISNIVRVLIEDKEENYSIETFYINLIHPDNQIRENYKFESPKSDSVLDGKFNITADIDEDYSSVRVILMKNNNRDFEREFILPSLNESIDILSYIPNIDSGQYDLVLEVINNNEIIYGEVINSVYLSKNSAQNPEVPESFPNVRIDSPNIDDTNENYDGLISFQILDQDNWESIVYLNGENISQSCSKTGVLVECIIDSSSINTGENKLGIEIFSGDIGTYIQNNFTVASISGQDDNNESEGILFNIGGNDVSLNDLIFLGIILGIGLVIILIPWILFLKWIKGPKKSPSRKVKQSLNTGDVKEKKSHIDKYSVQEGSINAENTDQNEMENIEYGLEILENNSDFNNPGFSSDPELPSSYSDEEIPDWLKDPSGSTPVGNTGDELKVKKPIDPQKSEPYGFDTYKKAESN